MSQAAEYYIEWMGLRHSGAESYGVDGLRDEEFADARGGWALEG